MDIYGPPNIEIRRSVETDLPDIQHCACEAYSRYIERMDREPAPMRADFENQIAAGNVDVATIRSEFAGYVVFYNVDDHLHLESVAVKPAYTGQGIGKQLIEHVERRAFETGYKAVELYTNEVMTENLAMYAKMGYSEVDRRIEADYRRVYLRKPV